MVSFYSLKFTRDYKSTFLELSEAFNLVRHGSPFSMSGENLQVSYAFCNTDVPPPCCDSSDNFCDANLSFSYTLFF